jgi:hypothetical protein
MSRRRFDNGGDVVLIVTAQSQFGQRSFFDRYRALPSGMPGITPGRRDGTRADAAASDDHYSVPFAGAPSTPIGRFGWIA